jgi:hypothetical protein
MSRAPPFTMASLARAIKGLQLAGRFVVGVVLASEKEMQTRVSHWLRDRERDGLIATSRCEWELTTRATSNLRSASWEPSIV